MNADEITDIIRLLVMLGQAVSSLDEAVRTASKLPPPTRLPKDWDLLLLEPSAGDKKVPKKKA